LIHMVYLGRTKRIHFVGIGGIGMSGIAEVLLNLGFNVTGSDIKCNDVTEKLESMGAHVTYGHYGSSVAGADVVVYSSAVDRTNPELLAASEAAIPIIPRTEMLAELMRLKFAVTIAGAHGKTSTTSLTSSVLAHGGLDPTVVVGGKLKASRSNTILGQSRYLVAEADESDGEFVQLPSSIAVITNIDMEHLDHYGTLDAIKRGFVEYANRVPFYGAVILCIDDENTRSIVPAIRRRVITYSLGGEANLRAEIMKQDETGSRFTVSALGEVIGEIHLGMPGEHYVRNALAAVAVGLELEIPFELIKAGIERFEGVGRRFEIKAELNGITIVDDYAHHPTEIAATIQAARANFGRRIIVLFQPHRFSRTQAIADKFGGCFAGASRVIMTDVYAAGEKPIPGVSARTIIAQVEKNGSVSVSYAPDFEAMVDEVLRFAEEGDIVITMGAGDIYKAGERLAERLAREYTA
jgi:UDP-N-acetylmuramate--alanine ligase